MPWGGGVKLDILADDVSGRKINIEVQQLPQGAEPVRARFHASLLDAHLLSKGKEFKDLPTVYIIFITKTDVFGAGKPIYTIRRKIDEIPMTFDDRTVIIYVNGACLNDTPLGQIMHDFRCTSADKMKCKPFADRMHAIKKFDGGRKMGALYDYIYSEGLEQGLEQGREEGAKKERHCMYAKMICKYIAKTQCTVADALEWFEVPSEDAPDVLMLVNEALEKQRAYIQTLVSNILRQTDIQTQILEETLKTKAASVSKYIQKTGCTSSEALDFFEIPESERCQIKALLKV